MHTPYEERADRSLRQARCIDPHAGPSSPFSVQTAQPPHRLADRPIDGLVVQTLQKAIQSREIERGDVGASSGSSPGCNTSAAW